MGAKHDDNLLPVVKQLAEAESVDEMTELLGRLDIDVDKFVFFST